MKNVVETGKIFLKQKQSIPKSINVMSLKKLELTGYIGMKRLINTEYISYFSRDCWQ